MVFIHGGSYEEGSANRYSGFPVANFGVVVVTVNYRLAELGILSYTFLILQSPVTMSAAH